jgi:hypothetical protein
MGFFSGITKIFKKIVKGVVDIVTGIVNVVVDAVSFLTGGLFDTPDVGAMNNTQSEAQSILLNNTGSLTNIPVIYGQRKVGGTIVFMNTKGGRNQDLYMAVTLGEGEISSVDQIFIDGVLNTDSRYNGLQTVNAFTGTSGQTASSLLSETSPWTSNHRLQGIAYLACKFTLLEVTTQEQSDKNPYGGVPQVQAVIKGKLIKSAAGLTNSHSTAYNDETGLIYSNNPADVILDYMRNPVYGAGVSNDRIDFASFSVARARYATPVTYQDGSTGPLHEINAVINTGETVMSNIKKLLAHCRSGMPYVQGRFKLKLQDTGNETNPQNPLPTSSYDITTAHLQDGIEITDGGVRDQGNQVRVSYIDPANNDWTPLEVVYPTLNSQRDQEMLAEDGGVRTIKQFTFDYCTNKNIAGYLAKMLCENERNRKTLGVVTTSELHEVEVGDVVTLTYPNLGINGNYYKVVSHDIQSNYTVALGLVEHNAQNYVFDNSEVSLGSSKQKQYVGNRPTYAYNYDGSDGSWNQTPVVPDPGIPSLPDNDPAGPTDAEYQITSVVSEFKLDRPNIQLETVGVTATIPTWVVDSANLLHVQLFVANTNSYVNMVTINPGVHIVSDDGAGSGVYKVSLNIDLNGQPQLFRISSEMTSGQVFLSQNFSYTAGTSIFSSSLGGTV